jgi:hypothetical protein
MAKKPAIHGKAWSNENVRSPSALPIKTRHTCDRPETPTDAGCDPVESFGRGHLSEAEESVTVEPPEIGEGVVRTITRRGHRPNDPFLHSRRR